MLSDEQTRYNIMQLELMAIEHALYSCRSYILRAKKTTVLSDSMTSLGQIRSCALPTSDRAWRYLSKIQQYPGTEFKYIDTKANGAADAISRGLLFKLKSNETEGKVISNLVEEIAANVQTQPITNRTIGNLPPDTAEKSTTSAANDKEFILALIKITHQNYLHAGQNRLRLLLNQLYPSTKFSDEAIKLICNSCKRCVEAQRLAPGARVDKVPLPTRPNETWSMDHFTPYPGFHSLHRKKTVAA